jgi:hypothetical protein
MKQTIYESFVKCHLSYALIVWGGKKSQQKTELLTQMKKVWRKIGPLNIHTNERLINYNIMKLEDELKLQEVKLIWRWHTKKIPRGLCTILTEKTSRQLRNRQFERLNNWKQHSISYRLATRAMKEIDEISTAKTKQGLKNKYKKIIKASYNSNCNIRNCFICSRTL